MIVEMAAIVGSIKSLRALNMCLVNVALTPLEMKIEMMTEAGSGSQTEKEEIQIYKKGRNSRPQNVPKSASVEEYRKSTGFECLVGFWMLRDESERFDQLMNDEKVQPFIESFLYSSRSIKPL